MPPRHTSLLPSVRPPEVGVSDDAFPRELADVNGDGKADIVGFGNAGVYVSLATGGGHFAAPTFELAAFGPAAGGWSSQDLYPRELADVNGDGKADIVGFGLNGVSEYLGTDAPSGLYALDATDTSDVDGDGIGRGAQIVLSQAAPGADIIGTVGAVEYVRISINSGHRRGDVHPEHNVWHDDVLNDDDP